MIIRKATQIIGLYIKEHGSSLTIFPSSKSTQFANYIIRIPNEFFIKIINNGEEIARNIWSEGNIQTSIKDTILIKEILGDIEIESHSSEIVCQDISGPIIASVSLGNVNVSFKKFNGLLPSSVNVFLGNINFSLPSDINCYVSLHTQIGDINNEFTIEDAVHLKIIPAL